MMKTLKIIASALTLISCLAPFTWADEKVPETYDAALAERLGADDYGMRSYIFVLIKTGPNDAEVTDPELRQQYFKGHFANMGKLAEEGHLLFAGPLDGVDGKRGIFVLNTQDIATAKEWLKGDPTVANGIFELDYHQYYGSAALMEVNAIHQRIQKTSVSE